MKIAVMSDDFFRLDKSKMELTISHDGIGIIKHGSRIVAIGFDRSDVYMTEYEMDKFGALLT